MISTKSYIISYISLKILNNEYKIDEKVPSENIFANKFKCTRLTARSAILVLVHLGVLYPVKGSGHYVSKNSIKILMPPLYLNSICTRYTNKKIENNNDLTQFDSTYYINKSIIGKVSWNINKNITTNMLKKYSLDEDVSKLIINTGNIGVKVCESLVNIDNLTYIKHTHYDEYDNFLYEFYLWADDLESISTKEYIKM